MWQLENWKISNWKNNTDPVILQGTEARLKQWIGK